MLLRRTSLILAAACGVGALAASLVAHGDAKGERRPFRFRPLPASAACSVGQADDDQFVLPSGYVQRVIAREFDGGSADAWDQNTLNRTGPFAERFLYRTHETSADGQVTVTDLKTGVTRILAERPDWNSLDGIVWTPWGTLLAAEEIRPGRDAFIPDPAVPQAIAGLVYELNPWTGASVARPALGAKAHEGTDYDSRGNFYGISETSYVAAPGSGPGGYIFRFVPDRRGDLSTGQLYALKIVGFTGDRTGEAIWVPLDRARAQVDADAAATTAGATGYNRPEDIAIDRAADKDGTPEHANNDVLYVATNEHRVLRVDLRTGPHGKSESRTAFVSDYVKAGVNAPAYFENPDNLVLHNDGRLFIAEDQDQPNGDDIWVAIPGKGRDETAARTVRFASLRDCEAEPTGIYFDKTGTKLFVNVQRRGQPDTLDLGMVITESRRD